MEEVLAAVCAAQPSTNPLSSELSLVPCVCYHWGATDLDAALPYPMALPLRETPVPPLVDMDLYLDGRPIDEWGNTVCYVNFSKLIAPVVRTG
ncbi:hypothetical protein VTN77DRAFT_8123 [Rasamsonia byssochlamydoides]|uniref:uncharacterized protein n=1 Tax=Rasamsonia byssochlamydoides TaxID=89139 RepID=UPI003741F320